MRVLVKAVIALCAVQFFGCGEVGKGFFILAEVEMRLEARVVEIPLVCQRFGCVSVCL